MKKYTLPFFEALTMLIGTVIGAGILGIPYVVANAGFVTGLINIIGIGLAILLLNLYVGEISLRTKGTHQLVGYAEKYLGKKAKFILMLSFTFGTLGALLAYMIGTGQSLAAIFGGNVLYFSLGFFIIASIFIYFDLKAIRMPELILVFLKIFIVVFLFFIIFPNIKMQNYTAFNPANIFLPYGVVLFAFLGASAIPEMRIELEKNKDKLKKAIILGSVIPIIIYALFAFFIVGLAGQKTAEIATLSLQVLGKNMFIIGNIFAVLAMATSFLILGLALKWMFHYDYHIPKKLAWFLVFIIPLIAFFAGARSFIGIIGFVGAITGGIDGIIIVLMARAAKHRGDRKPEYSIPINWLIMALLIALFLLGITYQFFKF